MDQIAGSVCPWHGITVGQAQIVVGPPIRALIILCQHRQSPFEEPGLSVSANVVSQYEPTKLAEFRLDGRTIGSGCLWLNRDREDGHPDKFFLEWGNAFEHAIGRNSGRIGSRVVVPDNEVTCDRIPNRRNGK
ncbi:hypothetical protein [Microvirga sp. BSC39]|uniref:hypothetical protein n=1 Tax=Microvirga sp. BSC39 TaxID=1549810 RepID=UPI0004E93F67|nr:hypothetical protein [Microvirga sp. BSC39]KFG69480.1 hypothetical protein JH26_10215 [Microvirga sp. BSC39]